MVAITDKGRRVVEKRGWTRRSALLPMRVSVEGRAVFEGATLDVSAGGIYFRMPTGPDAIAAVGARVWVEVSVPSELTGLTFGYRVSRAATVVRLEDQTLAQQVGRRPRSCGVALALDAEAAAPAVERSAPAAAAVA